jgi:hypothetical protein
LLLMPAFFTDLSWFFRLRGVAARPMPIRRREGVAVAAAVAEGFEEPGVPEGLVVG